ncbi:hypothetical protein H1Q63_12125 [Desmonostoc muscorum CCALA 125]|nr:hypothetical protein [Desmonostoc muscorum CCALA 125]
MGSGEWGDEGDEGDEGAGELQEINYPILWGGHLARSVHRASETPTLQELIGYFFICQSLNS